MEVKAVVLLAVLICRFSWCTATVYTVGDSSGWNTGVDYSSWVTGKTFVVGDSLVFNYGGMHDVAEVSSGNYAGCSTSTAVNSDASGTTTFTLDSAGTHYYICGAPGHCSGGMKLAVPVVSTSEGAAAGGGGGANGGAGVLNPTTDNTSTSTPAAAAAAGSALHPAFGDGGFAGGNGGFAGGNGGFAGRNGGFAGGNGGFAGANGDYSGYPYGQRGNYYYENPYGPYSSSVADSPAVVVLAVAALASLGCGVFGI